MPRLGPLVAPALFACLSAAACSQGLAVGPAASDSTDLGGLPASGDDGGAVVMPMDLGDNGAPSDVYPAPHPDPPEAVKVNAGARTLAAPRFVPVFFSGDDATIQMSAIDFLARIGASDFWKQTTSEYGVGPGTSSAPVLLAEAAPATIADSAIKTWLAGKLNSADPAFPAVTSDDIFVLFYPSGVTITLNSNGTVSRSCQGFGAYHGNIRLDANHKQQRVAYAVIPRCRGFGGGSRLDTLTVSTSHELTEAATDPYPSAGATYAEVDPDHLNWANLLGGGEVSDLCQQLPDADVRPMDLAPYAVQRGWSNASAKAGHDPCVPAPDQPYFAAAPELPDAVDYTIGNQTVSVLGVNIPVGEKRTITLDLFSDAPTARFTVNAKNVYRASYLTFTLDRGSGVNGEKLHLTIRSATEAPNLAADFVVTATLSGTTHSWYGVVGQVPP